MNKQRKFDLTLRTTLVLLVSLVFFYGAVAYAEDSPPDVVCVPATGLNPVIPHDTWSGLEISLKGTAHDADGDATLATYEWDFGDNSPPLAGVITDPYAIEARHVYTGSIGDLFVATLTITDITDRTGIDQYLVEIKDGSKLAVKVNVAIDEGLWRLHKDQLRDTFADGTDYGYWPYGANTVAATGASTEAFEIQGSLPNGNPDEDPYIETVQRGLSYLLSKLHSYSIVDPTYCPLGDPDTNGNGIGLVCYSDEDPNHSMYESGIALMALASSGCSDCMATTGIADVMGWSYLDVAQDMVDAFAYFQGDNSNWSGGWRYTGNNFFSDNSVSQWPVIGMESAEVNFGLHGLEVPQFVKDELTHWIDYIQNDVDGDWADGGSGYITPDPDDVTGWVNIAKTGGLLCEMKFVGDTIDTPRVQDAIDFIKRHWDSDLEHFLSNNYYAFYSVMKGFRLLGINKIPTDVITWDRKSGSPGDLIGSYSITENDDWILSITFEADGSVQLNGADSCGDRTASGIYSYDSASGDLLIKIKNSTLNCDWEVEIGTYEFFVSYLNGTMVWNEYFDWYADPDWGYAQYIVSDQNSDGSWSNFAYWSAHPLTSAWAILTLKKTVVQPGPVADPGSDVPSHPPVIEITFDGTASYHNDPSSEIVRYTWDFGDGSPAVEGAIVTHAFPAVYNTDGSIDWDATTRDYTVTLEVADNNSPTLTDSDTLVVSITPPPYPPVADANGPYAAPPCDSLTLNGAGSYDPNGAMYPDPTHPWHGEITSWEWDLDNNGSYNDAVGKIFSWSSCISGIHIVGLKVTNTFGESDQDDTIIHVSAAASSLPVADPNGPYLGPVVTPIAFDGSASYDPEGGILTYDWSWGDEFSSLNAGANPNHTYAVPGIYDVCLTVNDGDGGFNTACTQAVIFDPSGGFVTGGGWIDSQPGAFVPDPSLTGKASFGFVAKYQKNARMPVGQTEFQFHVADLNFHSSSYEWLVVNRGGANAQSKGFGSINKEGEYRFMIWAGDSIPDTFRIKIWTEDELGNENVVYDNGFEQEIEGGSIIIHSKM